MKKIEGEFNGSKGEVFTAGGKKQDGAGTSNISGTLKQISVDKFTVKQTFTATPGNKLVYDAIGNRPSAEVFKTYTIIDKNLIKYRSEIKMIDVDRLLKGFTGNQVGYTSKTESGQLVRCQ